MFTPVLAKHTKSFNLIDTLAVGVDRIQRSFEPTRRQVKEWRQAQITNERAELILYSAFVDGKLEAPRSLLSEVHRCISNHNTRSSLRGPCGASRMLSPAHSRNLTPFHSSRPRRSWGLSSLNCRHNATVSPFEVARPGRGAPALKSHIHRGTWELIGGRASTVPTPWSRTRFQSLLKSIELWSFEVICLPEVGGSTTTLVEV